MKYVFRNKQIFRLFFGSFELFSWWIELIACPRRIARPRYFLLYLNYFCVHLKYFSFWTIYLKIFFGSFELFLRPFELWKYFIWNFFCLFKLCSFWLFSGSFELFLFSFELFYVKMKYFFVNDINLYSGYDVMSVVQTNNCLNEQWFKRTIVQTAVVQTGIHQSTQPVWNIRKSI